MKGSLVTALILLLVLFSTAYGQYEMLSFDFSGGGARAEGMGKAYLGISDDVNGLSWNPAGIYGVVKPTMGVTWGTLNPKGRSYFLNGPFYTGFDHYGSLKDFRAFSFAAPVRIKGHPFVGSVSYVRNFDAFENQASYYEGVLWVEDVFDYAYLEQTVESRLEGGVNSLNVGFGTRLYGNISMGVCANIYGGSVLRQTFVTTYYPDIELPIRLEPSDVEQSITFEDTSKFSGVNFVVGLKYSGDKLNGGLIVRTPFAMRAEWDNIEYRITEENGLVMDAYTDTIYTMDLVNKYDVPWIVGLGLAYNVKENWLVAGDLELRAFSGGKVNHRLSITINPGGDNEEEWLEIDPQWSNVFVMRLGTEYLWQTSRGTVPLRAGLGLCQQPDPNIDAFLQTSKATCYNFSFGTGIHWSQIRFDAAYSVSTIDRHFYGIYDFTNRNQHINLSFTGVF